MHAASTVTNDTGADGLACFLGYPCCRGRSAGEAAQLSAASYFPRAWLLQKHYGSLLRGSWAERRAAKLLDEKRKDSSASATTDEDSPHPGPFSRQQPEMNGARLVPVRGCRAFPRGQQSLQRVATEGAGVFTPVGGMRQVSTFCVATFQHSQGRFR